MKNALVIVGVVAFVLNPLAAWGQCVTFDKPEDFYRLSDAVFVGMSFGTRQRVRRVTELLFA